MLSYLLLPENVTFALALGLLLILGSIQLVSFLVGTELFGSLDDAFGGHGGPDIDLDGDVDVHASLDGDVAADGNTALAEAAHHAAPTLGESLVSLLGLGKVPFIFSFLFFLFAYSAFGYNAQLLLIDLGLGPAPVWLGSLGAFVMSLPLLRAGNELMARVIPKDETTAVSEQTFVGKLARLTIGTATHARFTEARLEDEHGHTHLVQVFADEEGQSFTAGDQVVIVGRRGNQFTVVGAPAALRLEE